MDTGSLSLVGSSAPFESLLLDDILPIQWDSILFRINLILISDLNFATFHFSFLLLSLKGLYGGTAIVNKTAKPRFFGSNNNLTFSLLEINRMPVAMDFLKAEIERKRKLMEEAKVLKSSGPAANKYFKRGELLKKQVRKIMISN